MIKFKTIKNFETISGDIINNPNELISSEIMSSDISLIEQTFNGVYGIITDNSNLIINNNNINGKAGILSYNLSKNLLYDNVYDTTIENKIVNAQGVLTYNNDISINNIQTLETGVDHFTFNGSIYNFPDNEQSGEIITLLSDASAGSIICLSQQLLTNSQNIVWSTQAHLKTIRIY